MADAAMPQRDTLGMAPLKCPHTLPHLNRLSCCPPFPGCDLTLNGLFPFYKLMMMNFKLRVMMMSVSVTLLEPRTCSSSSSSSIYSQPIRPSAFESSSRSQTEEDSTVPANYNRSLWRTESTGAEHIQTREKERKVGFIENTAMRHRRGG